MAARRSEDVELPITFEVDGRPVRAREGESVALAMLASGRLVFGRSAKYHRPRGAACLGGRCDGCLMRVDGKPNQRTCRTRVREGMKVETQNVVGSAERDLLAVTDWFFPKGMDHHHMLTRFGGLNRAMQKVARRIAGLGELPTAAAPTGTLERRAVEVMVVGAGPAGRAAARAAQEAGAAVAVVSEGERSSLTGIEVAPSTTVIAAYAGTDAPAGLVLLSLDSADRLLAWTPRAVVLATGLVRGSLLFPSNDHPAVFTADAALMALRAGVLLGGRPLLVGHVGGRAEALRQAFHLRGVVVEGPVDSDHIDGLVGGKRLRAVRLKDGRVVDVDAVFVDAPPSAAYELAGQLGAQVRFDGSGFFAVCLDGSGRIAERAFACGGVVGALERAEAQRQGEAAGRAASRLAQGAAGEGDDG